MIFYQKNFNKKLSYYFKIKNNNKNYQLLKYHSY